MINLSGNWTIEYKDVSNNPVSGRINLPNSMQAAGFGDPVTVNTEFVSSLHDPEWATWDELAGFDDADVPVPFLSKPRRHFVGPCLYEREFDVIDDSQDDHFLFLELAKRTSKVWLDGEFKGEIESYCAPHIHTLGKLSKGNHLISIEICNDVYPGFRPDAHSVTDSVGESFNGIIGDIRILTSQEFKERYDSFNKYAKNNPRSVVVKDGNFYIDGKAEYIRGTHFGGDFPLTGFPSTDVEYYSEIFKRIKEWGFNLVRCHSFCPVEAMFKAADEEGMFLLVECGMWSYFGEGLPIMDFLRRETRYILREFGHHPSFVMLSPSNEPFGDWYKVLREWVDYARACDKELGYEGRRVYTAQSGWFYDTDPAHTEGTDFLYFHRSAYGPIKGGTVRNPAGWNGRNYSCSLEGVKLPVVCHELGQWCAYPDFDVASKFTGFLKPSNYRAFKNLADRNGLLPFAKEMHYCSGKNQLRLLKEEFEANYRTPELKGYEYLDVHDYPGQGTALVGVLDAFFDPKEYADKDYFRQFNSEDVLACGFESYVVGQGTEVFADFYLSHYSQKLKYKYTLTAELSDGGESIYKESHTFDSTPERGFKGKIGRVGVPIPEFPETRRLNYTLSLDNGYSNSWELFAVKETEPVSGERFVECHSFTDAFKALDAGEKVLFLPDLSELDYDCTPCNERSIYWNGQMGPKWERSCGLVCDTESSFFKLFPTDKSGGFQWGSVLRAGRAFKIPGAFKPLVRVIDDWNRSIPQAFLLEAKVGNGKLLMSAFDRNASDSVENKLFYAALTRYIDSDDFDPKQELNLRNFKDILFPVNRMKGLVDSVTCIKGLYVANPEGMVLSNPSIVTEATGEPSEAGYEVSFEIKFKHPVEIKGFLWLNDQRKRIRDNYAKTITVIPNGIDHVILSGGEAGVEGSYAFTLKNTPREQYLYLPEPVVTDSLVLTVDDTYGREEVPMWVEGNEGFERLVIKKSHRVGIAAFHVICDETVPGNNERFWEKGDEVLTREIDI